MNEETGRLVVPRSSILIFRRQVVKRHLLWMIAGYICGGEETRHIWHLIRKKHSKRHRQVAAAVQSLSVLQLLSLCEEQLAVCLAPIVVSLPLV